MKYFVFEHSDDIHKKRHYATLESAFEAACEHPLGGVLIVRDDPPFERPFLSHVYCIDGVKRIEQDLKRLLR